MMLIEFKGLLGEPIFAESTKIAGVAKKNEEQTFIFITCERECDEWLVEEPYRKVVSKIPCKE